MAIIKIVNVKSGKPYGLKAVLDYIQNPAKTENGRLVSAQDCMVETAFQQMMLTKHQYSKTTGRQYIHIIQSFPVDEKLSPELAHQIGQKLLGSFQGYQGVVTTHTDRNHIHNHIVLNSVHQQTGEKWQLSKSQLYEMRNYSDQLCKFHGLSVIEKGQGWKSYGEHTGKSWKWQLAQTVAQTLRVSFERDVFLHRLYKHGITVEFGKKNLLFILPDGKRCSSEKLRHYGDFSGSNIERHLQYNNQALRAGMRNRDIVTQAFRGIAALFPDRETNNMINDYYTGKMPVFEGQALVDWILMRKGASCINWDEKPLEQREQGILETLTRTFEQINQQQRRPAPVIQEMDDEEWEL